MSAYLVIWVGVEKPWPELLGAGIYSEAYPSCHLNRQRPVPIYKVEGVEFARAKLTIIEYAMGPGQEWVRALLDRGMPDWNRPNEMIGRTFTGTTDT